jgi:hypothetical protein
VKSTNKCERNNGKWKIFRFVEPLGIYAELLREAHGTPVEKHWIT